MIKYNTFIFNEFMSKFRKIHANTLSYKGKIHANTLSYNEKNTCKYTFL